MLHGKIHVFYGGCLISHENMTASFIMVRTLSFSPLIRKVSHHLPGLLKCWISSIFSKFHKHIKLHQWIELLSSHISKLIRISETLFILRYPCFLCTVKVINAGLILLTNLFHLFHNQKTERLNNLKLIPVGDQG
jgi:hypothetical protein